MASVTIQRVWPDGDVLTIHVKVGHAYPDELSEALRTAIDGYLEAMTATLA